MEAQKSRLEADYQRRAGNVDQALSVLAKIGALDKELAALKEDLAKPAAPASGGKATLGPVVELTVNDYNVRKDMFVDLDSGRLFTPPADLGNIQTEAGARWIRENGIDARGNTSPSLHGLEGFDMAILPFASERWDGVTAQNIPAEELLSKAQPSTIDRMTGKGDLPVTYLFRTREGGMGILQIVGFAEDPKGVKIRYRLVQGAADLPRDVAQLASLAKALEIFSVDVGRYPTTEELLQALVKQPAGLAAWRGPYVTCLRPPAASTVNWTPRRERAASRSTLGCGRRLRRLQGRH